MGVVDLKGLRLKYSPLSLCHLWHIKHSVSEGPVFCVCTQERPNLWSRGIDQLFSYTQHGIKKINSTNCKEI